MHGFPNPIAAVGESCQTVPEVSLREYDTILIKRSGKRCRSTEFHPSMESSDQAQLETRWVALEAKLEEIIKPFARFQPYFTPDRFSFTRQYYQNKWNALSSSSDATKQIEHLDNSQACTELLLDMLAYYDNAVETFTDNLISLGVESCLLSGLSDLIGSDVIATMSNSELSKYAAEPEDTVTRRIYAQQKQRMLQTSLEFLQDQVWTGVSLSYNSGRAATPPSGEQDTKHSATSGSHAALAASMHNPSPPKCSSDRHSPSVSNHEIESPRTPEGNVQRSRSTSTAPCSQNENWSGTGSQAYPASPSSATPSARGFERDYGRISHQQKEEVPVYAETNSDSGMSVA